MSRTLLAVDVAGVTVAAFMAAVAYSTIPPARRPDPVTAAPAQTAAPPEVLHDLAEGPARVGDLWVRLLNAGQGKIPFRQVGTNRHFESEEAYFWVRLKLENARPAGNVPSYRRGRPPHITDGRGRVYPPAKLPKWARPAGLTQGNSVRPGHHYEDVLVFEPPGPGASGLVLSLPPRLARDDDGHSDGPDVRVLVPREYPPRP